MNHKQRREAEEFALTDAHFNVSFRVDCWVRTRASSSVAKADSCYARLHGLTRDELRYILGPKEVYGEVVLGETFRVLKGKEIKQYGEYRTRRLV